MAETPRLTVRERAKAAQHKAPVTNEDWHRRPSAAPAGPPVRALAPGERPSKAGARVTVRAYDVLSPSRRQFALWPDHQYAVIEDGKSQFIARGGPDRDPRRPGEVRLPYLDAKVTPATKSLDHGRGGRVLYEGVAPGQSAAEVAGRVSDRMARATAQRPPYLGVISNSNTALANAMQPELGFRVGQWFRTPGAYASPRQRPPSPPPPRMPPLLGG